MHRSIASALLAGSLLFPALARADVTQSDKDFMAEAAQGGMAEVKMGELARTKGQSDKVKSFADRMVTDHTKANDDLKAVATQKGVTLPTDMGAEEQQTYDKLNKLSGADFDKAYMDAMVKDHDKDVAAFEKHAKSTKDPDLKGFVQKTLPVLKDHKKMAHAGGASKTM
jgi:putative membrane protein